MPTIIGFEGAPRKILVVDDKWGNRSVLVDLLTTLGFIVYQAEDGKVGLEMAVHSRPDLILTDLLMPVMDGFKLVAQLRLLKEFKEIPIIAVSASVFEHHRQQSLGAGCNDFLAKPIQTEILFNLLQKHLALQWIYERPQTPLSSVTTLVDHLVTSENLWDTSAVPTYEQATILYNLAFTDELSSVVNQAEQFARINPYLIPFVKVVQQLAKEFKEEQLCQLLEKYLPPSSLPPVTP